MSPLERDYEDLLRRALHATADAAEPAEDGLERIRARCTVPYPRPVAALVAGYSEMVGRALDGLQAVAAWPQAEYSAAGRMRGALTRSRPPVPPDYGTRLRWPARAAGWRGWLAPAACAVLVAAVAAGSVALSQIVHGPRPAPHMPGVTATANRAAAWIAGQVSRSAIVACDPTMCLALKAHGFPVGDLDQLRPGRANLLGANVVVVTPAVRSQFGRRLRTVYAPAVLASFGSGRAHIALRVIAMDGAAAYRSQAARDLADRQAAGRQLLQSTQIRVAARARRQLLAGQVDARLLVTIANIAANHPLSIVAFSDSGPGAGAGSPLRAVELTGTDPRVSAAVYVHAMRVLLGGQSPPYQPTQVQSIQPTGSRPLLRVEFAAPSPLGLLAPLPEQGASSGAAARSGPG